MKTLKNGWWMLAAALVIAGCQQGGEEARSEDEAPVAEESPAVAEESAEEAAAEQAAREKAPPTPVVIYFKAEPTEADLEWLRENGFVVGEVTGKTVSGRFEYVPSPDFSDDPRLDRVVPLQRPPGPN